MPVDVPGRVGGDEPMVPRLASFATVESFASAASVASCATPASAVISAPAEVLRATRWICLVIPSSAMAWVAAAVPEPGVMAMLAVVMSVWSYSLSVSRM